MVKEIILACGKTVLVDDADFAICNKFLWRLKKGPTGMLYARVNINRKDIYLHVMIMRPPRGLMVDHINRNGLDCRRENMRIVTSSQNQRNTWKRAGITSIYKGVNWNKKDRRWRAQICVQYIKIFLGNFEIEEEAARAYDKAAKLYFGEFAVLNFPNEP